METIPVASAVSESSRIRTSPDAGNDALEFEPESQNLKQPSQCPARGLQGGVDCSQQTSAGDLVLNNGTFHVMVRPWSPANEVSRRVT